MEAPVVAQIMDEGAEGTFLPPRGAGYTRGMGIVLPALAVAFAALCVWLGVRVWNRRERLARRTMASVSIGVPVLYFASFGPACWIESYRASEIDEGDWGEGFDYLQLYRPIEYIWERAPRPIANLINRYCYAYAGPDWEWQPLAWRRGISCMYPFGFWRVAEEAEPVLAPEESGD